MGFWKCVYIISFISFVETRPGDHGFFYRMKWKWKRTKNARTFLNARLFFVLNARLCCCRTRDFVVFESAFSFSERAIVVC